MLHLLPKECFISCMSHFLTLLWKFTVRTKENNQSTLSHISANSNTKNIDGTMCTGAISILHITHSWGHSLHSPGENYRSPAVNDFEASEQAVFVAYLLHLGCSLSSLAKALAPLKLNILKYSQEKPSEFPYRLEKHTEPSPPPFKGVRRVMDKGSINHLG